MNDKIDDGGPAFPLTEDAVNYKNRDFPMQGMTLRDAFAMATLSDCLFNATPEDIARNAYAIADAMLEARKK